MTTTTTTRPTTATVQTWADRVGWTAFAAYLALMAVAFKGGGFGYGVTAAVAFAVALAAGAVHDVAKRAARQHGRY